MLVRWWRRRRGKAFVHAACEASWRAPLLASPFALELPARTILRLVELAGELERQVRWEGRDGFEVAPHVARGIALQASRLVLGLGLAHYRRLRLVVVHPGAFEACDPRARPLVASGLATSDGTVHLAWDHVRAGVRDPRDGRNVVYHEFAHVLDMLDGEIDGVPPHTTEWHAARWRRVAGREFRGLKRALGRRQEVLLDPYGSSDPAEFFAECTEVFFERPGDLRRRHPLLFRALVKAFRQDPERAARLPDPSRKRRRLLRLPLRPARRD